MNFPELTDVEKVCNTSVQDATISIRNINDIDLLERALKYEGENYNRATLKQVLSSRIRKIKKAEAK